MHHWRPSWCIQDVWLKISSENKGSYQHMHILITIDTFVTYIYWPIDIMVRLFTNSPGDRGSISCQVISKTQKMVFDAFLFNTLHYKVQIKGKWSNPGKGVATSPTPWHSSYWKGSLWLLSLTLLFLLHLLLTPTQNRMQHKVNFEWSFTGLYS